MRINGVVRHPNLPGSHFLSRRQVLLVEDEQDIADLLTLHLRDLDVDVTHVTDGHEAIRAVDASSSWSLIILDLRLPGVDGLEVCRHIRKNSEYLPVLMLTSKSSELDRVLGLELGADDYMTKPFSILELMARVKALFRRASAMQNKAESETSEQFQTGDISINQGEREVKISGQHVDLTAKEFELLLHLARYPNHVFSRGQLLDQVWGYGHHGYEHTVNSHINRLRAKIESNPAQPQRIMTVRGVGYKLSPREAH